MLNLLIFSLFCGLALVLLWHTASPRKRLQGAIGGHIHRYRPEERSTLVGQLRENTSPWFQTKIFPFGLVTVLARRDLADAMLRAPSEALSFDEVSVKLIQPEFTLFGLVPLAHSIQVMNKLFNRRLNTLLPSMKEDIASILSRALELHIAQSDGWNILSPLDIATFVIPRVILPAVVGDSLAQDPVVQDTIFNFVRRATKLAFYINSCPRPLQSLVSRVVLLLSHRASQQLSASIAPIIKSRSDSRPNDPSSDEPSTYLNCLIEASSSAAPIEATPDRLAARVLQFAFASYHTSINALAHLLLDLASEPSCVDLLRQQLMSTISSDSGLDNMHQLTLMDSFLAESARLNPVGITVDRACNIGLTSLARFVKHDYVISLPASAFHPSAKVAVANGTTVIAPMDLIHKDPQIYSNPEEFQPWRFALNKDKRHKAYTSITPHYLYFGSSKHPCPGRFFAEMELKATLCHLIADYELRSPNIAGERPSNEERGVGVLPDPMARVLIRRRGG